MTAPTGRHQRHIDIVRVPDDSDAAAVLGEALESDRQAALEEIRTRLVSPSSAFLFGRLATVTARVLRLDSTSVPAAAATVVMSAGIRLALPTAVTLAFGTWAEAQVGRWAVVAVVLGLMDAGSMRRHRESRQSMQDFTALLATIDRARDLQQLRAFTRRWYQLRVSSVVSAAISALILLACGLAAPAELRAVPVGTVALLGLIAYEVGELLFFQLAFMVPFLRKETRFEHRLFWLSPVDSTPVRKMVQSAASGLFLTGLGVTGYLVLALFLVTPASALLMTLVAAFTATGYASTLISMVGVRTSVGTIARRVRDQRMDLLQRRIDHFGPRVDQLSQAESEDLQRLIATYMAVRDAPISPKGSEALGHAAKALLIPTLGFFLAVLSEVYAERLLDQLIP